MHVTTDSGLASLVLLLRINGVAADPAKIRHRFADEAIGVDEMLLCAREFGLKARALSSDWQRLAAMPMPAIVGWNDGNFVVVYKVSESGVIVLDPEARGHLIPAADFIAGWTGRIVVMVRRLNLLDLARRFDVGWFLQAMHKYRRLLAEVLVASLFMQLFALVTPLFFQVVIDKVLVQRGIATLDVLVIGLVAVSVFETVLTILRTYVFAHTTNRIDVVLGARLFRHLLALPLAYFEARRTGDSVARVRELENIRNFLTSSALTLVIDLFFTFVFLAVMATYSLALTGIVLATFPFYIGLSLAVTPAFRRRLDEKFNRGAENQAFLVESVTGVETLKAMAVEPRMQRSWEDQLAAYVTASFRVVSLGNWASQVVQLINKLMTAATLYFGAYLVINGTLTVGELVAFNILASRVAQPVLRLAQLWQDFHQARLSILRLGDILNTPPEPTLSMSQSPLQDLKGEIVFDHIGFRYHIDGPEILKDLTLRIPAGQIVGVIGPSGSGKSTLAKLVQRLYVPERGRVLIDGIDLATVDVAELRAQIGVVLQDNVLFNRSIRENIALADPGRPLEAVVAAARLAGAEEFILKLADKYDAKVGERGTNLSGGQRQRVAIARALFGAPRILVLDEATSALDFESEHHIRKRIWEIADNRTVIIVAHRLSMIRCCDRIVTLQEGRVTEDGTHEELVRRGGYYAALHRAQTGDDELG